MNEGKCFAVISWSAARFFDPKFLKNMPNHHGLKLEYSTTLHGFYKTLTFKLDDSQIYFDKEGPKARSESIMLGIRRFIFAHYLTTYSKDSELLANEKFYDIEGVNVRVRREIYGDICRMFIDMLPTKSYNLGILPGRLSSLIKTDFTKHVQTSYLMPDFSTPAECLNLNKQSQISIHKP
jgi:hypothetical protein